MEQDNEPSSESQTDLSTTDVEKAKRESSTINIAVRIRPFASSNNDISSSYEIVEPSTIILKEKKRIKDKITEKRHSFSFDHVLKETATQDEVYMTVKPMVESWMQQGKHAAVFAYGFTGTGKSHTLFGTKEHPGIILSAASEILAKLDFTTGVSLRVSMYEIAGNICSDLLADHNRLKVRTDAHGNIHLRQDEGGVAISTHLVTSMSQFVKLLEQAREARRVGSSTVHDESSRSHGVVDMQVISNALIAAEEKIDFCHRELIRLSNKKDDLLRAQIEEAYKRDGPAAFMPGTPLGDAAKQHGMPYMEASHVLDAARAEYETLLQNSSVIHRGKFSFIDMAGNDWEKATDVQTTISRAEHAAINTSLLAVKECFRALAKKPPPSRIPFRNSPLTQVLKRHFEPGVLLLMIATVGMPVTEVEEDNYRFVRQSFNTLSYAKLIK